MSGQTVTRKLKLCFAKRERGEPIIHRLVKDYDLVVNVFRAKITPEEEGYLVLDLTGDEDRMAQALEFVGRQNVTVDTHAKGVTWDDRKCVHCGNCLTHCPTHALRIVNPKTREVGFDESKCIECQNCLRVCPYGACESLF